MKTKLNTTNLSVHFLRQNKYKVRVLHFRLHKVIDNFDTLSTKNVLFSPKELELYKMNNGINRVSKQPLVKGGKLTLEIATPDGKEYTIETICSKKDCYQRRRAVQIALGRFRKILESEN